MSSRYRSFHCNAIVEAGQKHSYDDCLAVQKDGAGRASRLCAGSACHIGAVTGRGCDGNQPCPLLELAKAGVIEFPIADKGSPDVPHETAEAVTEVTNARALLEHEIVARWIDRHGYPPPHLSINALVCLVADAIRDGAIFARGEKR